MASRETSTRTRTARQTETGPDGKTMIKTTVTKITTDHDGKETTTVTETSQEATPKMLEELRAASEASGRKVVGKPQGINEFRKEVIRMHNHYRKIHGKVGDLKQNKDLDKMAQDWADELAKKDRLAHSEAEYKSETLGENVASKGGKGSLVDYTGKDICEHWYKEEAKHDFSKDHQEGSGHFSQMVWKGSREIGIGKAFRTTDDLDSVYVVVHYYPAGNYLTKYSENVIKKHK